MNNPEFRKTLAKYYIRWFQDCHKSAIYCREHGNESKAKQYLDDASKYLNTIMENWEAIEFFSVEDNCFKHKGALPEEFRDYE